MKTNPRVDFAILFLRIGLGLAMIFFGSQKLFGTSGGPGYQGTIAFMDKAGISSVFAHLAIAGEFLGGLGVLLGAFTSLAAFGVACTMAVATYQNIKDPGTLHAILTAGNHPEKLFFSGTLFFAAVCVMIIGDGRYSLDSKLFKKGKR